MAKYTPKITKLV